MHSLPLVVVAAVLPLAAASPAAASGLQLPDRSPHLDWQPAGLDLRLDYDDEDEIFDMDQDDKCASARKMQAGGGAAIAGGVAGLVGGIAMVAYVFTPSSPLYLDTNASSLGGTFLGLGIAGLAGGGTLVGIGSRKAERYDCR